jgi:hypothetical protein
VRLTDIDESGRSGLSVTVKIPGGRQPGCATVRRAEAAT